MSSKQTPIRSRTWDGRAGGIALGGENGDECDLAIDVDLEGVRLSRLELLKIGDTLRVDLRSEGAFPTVVCVDAQGELVGALSAFLNLARLIKCLRNGVEYQVEVTHIRSGGCHVVGNRVP